MALHVCFCGTIDCHAYMPHPISFIPRQYINRCHTKLCISSVLAVYGSKRASDPSDQPFYINTCAWAVMCGSFRSRVMINNTKTRPKETTASMHAGYRGGRRSTDCPWWWLLVCRLDAHSTRRVIRMRQPSLPKPQVVSCRFRCSGHAAPLMPATAAAWQVLGPESPNPCLGDTKKRSLGMHAYCVQGHVHLSAGAQPGAMPP